MLVITEAPTVPSTQNGVTSRITVILTTVRALISPFTASPRPPSALAATGSPI